MRRGSSVAFSLDGRLLPCFGELGQDGEDLGLLPPARSCSPSRAMPATSIVWRSARTAMPASGRASVSVTIWESVPPEVQDRAANQMVAGSLPVSFRQRSRQLRTLLGMSLRIGGRRALAAAKSYPENPGDAHHSRRGTREAARPRVALTTARPCAGSEGACQLEPKNGNYLNTLGAAYCRMWATLTKHWRRSDARI